METKSIKEEIKNLLEVLNEQFAIIDEHQKRIPQIELDIVLANIRNFYELFFELNKLNSYNKNSIDANIVENFVIENQDFSIPQENKDEIRIENPDNTVISIDLEPKEKISEIIADDVVLEVQEVPDTSVDSFLPIEETLEPVVEETFPPMIVEEPKLSIETFITKVDAPLSELIEETVDPIVEETLPPIIVEESEMPVETIITKVNAPVRELLEETMEPIKEETKPPVVVEEPKFPLDTIITKVDTPVNELIITKVDVPEQKVGTEIPKDVHTPVKTGKQQAIDLFSLAEKEIVADKFKETPKLMHEKIVHDKPDNTLANKVGKTTITNLKNAIGINDKFLFINELFKGDLQEYNKTIDMLNSFIGIEEANVFFEDLKEKYNWNDKPDALHKLEELIIRKFL